MWFRGPDFNLGLVNTAFVHAVEGRDAQDVIQRSAELSMPRAQIAQAQQLEAQESGQIVARMQPAIVHGERRMLRIVDLSSFDPGAVAGFAVDVQELEERGLNFTAV